MIELEHRYGKNVHILNNPFLLSHLATLCHPNTTQPLVNLLIETLYSSLLQTVVNAEFPIVNTKTETRMKALHPNEGYYQGPIVDPNSKVVIANLARAGVLPSHVCYQALNFLVKPENVRQDHINISRQTNTKSEVTGSHVSGHKIGGSIQDSLLLFPDPMGATGSTIVESQGLYKSYGSAKKVIAMHCIITPEYIKHVHASHPNIVIYAIRLDRGLSSQDVLDSIPGTHWNKERGLNEKQYIVPGGGGLGEVLNNSYV
jgi:uracil phosphoribosyltransferase